VRYEAEPHNEETRKDHLFPGSAWETHCIEALPRGTRFEVRQAEPARQCVTRRSLVTKKVREPFVRTIVLACETFLACGLTRRP